VKKNEKKKMKYPNKKLQCVGYHAEDIKEEEKKKEKLFSSGQKKICMSISINA
jgi:hypothetical protein